jgi:hypothetical protein
MCFGITPKNVKDFSNIGKKYIAICEQNDPVISRLVQYLSEIMRVQRLNRKKAILATAAHHNLPLGGRPNDKKPFNLEFFPHDHGAGVWKWQVFSGFLATLNDVGFPRRALYGLLRQLAENHDISRILTAEDKSSFTTLANKLSTRDAAGIEVPKIWNFGKGRKKREAWQLAYQQFGNQSHVTANDIFYSVRYIDRTEVDWWMEREKIIVPKDFETAASLLYLNRMRIWNFAHNLDEIKSIDECWQNILIFKSDYPRFY